MKRRDLYYSGIIILVFFAVMLVNSCKKDADEIFYGKLNLKFEYKVDGNPMELNVMKYINEAGNHYKIKEIQWFISDFTLYQKGKSPYVVNKVTNKHYIDTGLPLTQTWEMADDIPEGNYDSISFVFGFTPTENISYMFLNPPENAMLWPENLGGGYHYMKLNGFWKDTNNFDRAFNFHMGIGRTISGTDTAYVHNFIKLSFNTPVTLLANKKKEITIVMNIDQWFKGPHIWDFNFWGPAIMDNQNAMRTVKENGENGVFTISSIKDL